MTFEEDVRAWLLSKKNIGGVADVAELVGQRVHYGSVPQGIATPYVWFEARFADHVRALDDGPGSFPHVITVDVTVVDPDASVALDLAVRVRLLDSYRGQFGSGRVQGVFVNDIADGYEPRELPIGNDRGLFIPNASLDIHGYQPGVLE